MYLGADPEPGTPEFGERARQRRARLRGYKIPPTYAPPIIDTAVKYWGDKAETALFGDLDKTIRTVAFVGIGIGLLWFLRGSAR